MSDRFFQIEQKLAAANKRIADLETKYLALLEDLKTLRAELALRGTFDSPVIQSPGYQPAFDRWPGASR
jgi:hypothetical protein